MNKEKIVKELNEYVKGLDPKLSVENDIDGDLRLSYSGVHQAWFNGFDHNDFGYNVDGDIDTLFIKEGYLTKFYNKAIELMDKYGAKYTVQVVKHDSGSYLNLNKLSGKYTLCTASELRDFKTHFTKSEIEELKKRDDLAVDWDKAIIKEVTD